jgi:hypothetical protein
MSPPASNTGRARAATSLEFRCAFSAALHRSAIFPASFSAITRSGSCTREERRCGPSSAVRRNSHRHNFRKKTYVKAWGERKTERCIEKQRLVLEILLVHSLGRNLFVCARKEAKKRGVSLVPGNSTQRGEEREDLQSFSRAARSSRASENSPSSIPSPTNQCTNARFEYSKSNLRSRRLHAVAIAVVFESMHSERETLARSPPGTFAGGSLQMPSLKPVGHQSTNWIVRFVLIAATADLSQGRPSYSSESFHPRSPS